MEEGPDSSTFPLGITCEMDGGGRFRYHAQMCTELIEKKCKMSHVQSWECHGIFIEKNCKVWEP